jgi:hypothetical protein
MENIAAANTSAPTRTPPSRNMTFDPLVSKIISGGQAGVDRAALDCAIAHDIPHGGWCPAGRKAEDGTIDAKYQLQETESANYRARTSRNVQDGDATLILNLGELEGGTLETLRIAEREGKPVQTLQIEDATAIVGSREWLERIHPRVLNVAGPRESKRPGIYLLAYTVLNKLLSFPLWN